MMHKNSIRIFILLSFGFIFFIYPGSPAYTSETLKINTLSSDANKMILEVRLSPLGLFKNTQPENRRPFRLPPNFAELIGVPGADKIDVKILNAEYSLVTAQGLLEEEVYDEDGPEWLRSGV